MNSFTRVSIAAMSLFTMLTLAPVAAFAGEDDWGSTGKDIGSAVGGAIGSKLGNKGSVAGSLIGGEIGKQAGQKLQDAGNRAKNGEIEVPQNYVNQGQNGHFRRGNQELMTNPMAK